MSKQIEQALLGLISQVSASDAFACVLVIALLFWSFWIQKSALDSKDRDLSALREIIKEQQSRIDALHEQLRPSGIKKEKS